MSIQKAINFRQVSSLQGPQGVLQGLLTLRFLWTGAALPLPVVQTPKGIWTACPLDKDVLTVWWLRAVQQEAFLLPVHLPPQPQSPQNRSSRLSEILRASPGSSVSSGPLPWIFFKSLLLGNPRRKNKKSVFKSQIDTSPNPGLATSSLNSSGWAAASFWVSVSHLWLDCYRITEMIVKCSKKNTHFGSPS